MRLLLTLLVFVFAGALLTAPVVQAKTEGPPNAAEKDAKPKKAAPAKDPKAKPQKGKSASQAQPEPPAESKPEASGSPSAAPGQPSATPKPVNAPAGSIGPQKPGSTDAGGQDQVGEANSAETPAPAGKSSTQVGPEPPGKAAPARPELPPIARDQPGFIPDKTPEDLFSKPEGQTPRERYKSLLGPSKLPEGRVTSIIGEVAGNPGNGLGDNQARVVVPDGSIEGTVNSKQFKIRGGVIIFYNDVQITAEEADIDSKGETAVLRDSVEIVDPNYDLKTNELRIFFGQKKFEALGFVQFKKNAKPESSQPNFNLGKKERLRNYFSAQQFELYCNKLYYDWGAKTMTALQAIRIQHPAFDGTMERLDYNDKDKAYAMEGGVNLNVSNYDWIFKNQLVDAKDEQRVRAVTDQPTKITADKVNYSDDSATAQFYALSGKQVTFDQTERKVTANYIEVNDKTKDFYAEGDQTNRAVFDQTSGDWLMASGMISEQTASDDLKKTLKKPMSAKARTITFNYDRKRLELTDNVEVANDTQTLTAGKMVQDDTSKFFLVRDNVHIKTDANTEIQAAQVYVDTANDVYTFVGLVSGKASGGQLGLPNPQQPGSQFGQAAQLGQSPQPTDNGNTNGNGTQPTRLGQPGLFQEQR